MKFLIPLAATALIIGACSDADTSVNTLKAAETVATDTMSDAAASPKTKAVLVYADWCGSCKVLDPKIKAVKAMGPMPGLDFVTLDFTNKNADAFFAQAEAAGVGQAVQDYLNGTVKTGQLLLVDMDDQIVRAKVTKDLDNSEIVQAMRSALAAS